MFESAVLLASTDNVTSNSALITGSSQQGKHRRACVGSNWVTAKYLSSSPATLQ